MKKVEERKDQLAKEAAAGDAIAARRLEIVDSRYITDKGQLIDKYMRAFMMILADVDSHGILFQNRRKKEITSYLDDFGDKTDDAQIAEWKEFASEYIEMSLKSKSYGKTLFGLISLQDRRVALKIASDIDNVTRVVPEKYGLIEKAGPLRKALSEVFIETIEDGEEIWDECLKG